ncbi:uncharacterized protein N7479_005696 [Penicillium vulpinum]|uniref:uncharacterized protein n=1 Tax=Penicillium vulpinum TaxID=29845 RepID=UPI002546E016|nr:uncharacterized protein N7479_005696 [Penicillium vulpinum]KAJ5958546.1 hypothetical protein N7479_005696 [Penicillium vulpinum]
MSQPPIELSEWAQPWLSGVSLTRSMEQIPSGSPCPRSQNSFRHTGILTKFPEKRLAVTLGREWTVSRALRGIRLFKQMIAVNATLGTGLYWRGGQIFELGEPLAVIISFMSIGILTWAVMQCITEMLCIWPIPGALLVYVCLFDILLYIGGNLRRGVQFLGLHPHQRSYTGRAYISNHSTGTRLRQFDKDQSMLYPSLLINANVFDLGAKRVNLGG